MGILDTLRRWFGGMSKEESEEHKRRRSELLSFKGKQASTADSRLTLYESGLRALMQGGQESSFIIFECMEKEQCYVQFAGGSTDPSGLHGEIAGEPVSERERSILLQKGFREPYDSNPNYHQEFENADPHELADLVEEAFTHIFHCPASYTAHVVNVD